MLQLPSSHPFTMSEIFGPLTFFWLHPWGISFSCNRLGPLEVILLLEVCTQIICLRLAVLLIPSPLCFEPISDTKIYW